jgi:hypothetical protein
MTTLLILVGYMALAAIGVGAVPPALSFLYDELRGYVRPLVMWCVTIAVIWLGACYQVLLVWLLLGVL